LDKKILAALFITALVTLAGCGEEISTTPPFTLNSAVTSDPSLFDVGESETGLSTSALDDGFSILVSATEEARCYSWYRRFTSTGAITIAQISVEALTAEVVVTRSNVRGLLNVRMTSASTTSPEAFKQDFKRYIILNKIEGVWRIKKVTQGVSRSLQSSTTPYNSVGSDITIDSVSIYDVTGGVTFDVTGGPTAEGPWIDYDNIPHITHGNTMQITVVAEQIGNASGPVPYVFIWPDLDGTGGFSRHQLPWNNDALFSYTYTFTIPADETRGRKKMTIGVFAARTLTSEEATLGAYDLTSWHIPYEVK